MSLLKKRDPEVEAERKRHELIREQDAKKGEASVQEVLLQQQEQRQDLLKWQQDLRAEWDQFEHDIKGEVKQDGKWVPQKVLMGYDQNNKPVYENLKPLMNDIGIRMVETCCCPLLNRNIINSNLSEEMVLGLLRRTMDSIVTNVAYYGEDRYDMEFGNYSLVTRMIKNMIIPTPFRALSGWNKKIDSTISKRVEAYMENPGATGKVERKKLFGIF